MGCVQGLLSSLNEGIHVSIICTFSCLILALGVLICSHELVIRGLGSFGYMLFKNTRRIHPVVFAESVGFLVL
eukprot:SAG11_NODE_225_length_12064_cov_7.850815_17_plen_73_part_00